MRTILAVAYDQIALTELALAYHVFAYPYESMPKLYDFRVCAGEPGPIRTRPGFTIDCQHGLRALADADAILIPAWRNVDEQPPEPLLRALRRAHDAGAELISICTGSFVLAAAGLLNGRRATTHWMHVDALRRRYPAVQVLPEALYVDDGDILTSAGTAAGIDLCLHIVRRDHGAEIANEIGRRMIVPPHRAGGQQQYIDRPLGRDSSESPIGSVLNYAVEHLDEPLTTSVLAKQLHMSLRSFARHFRQATGTTPLQWLLTQRVLRARRLLEETDKPVEQIGRESGLGSPPNFRAQFKRLVGTSPSAYRQTFRLRPPPADAVAPLQSRRGMIG
jgi:AraC family transcriptional regulator, transcriptional activator FtrA